MGLFDKLAKFGSDLAKSEIRKKIGEEIDKVLPDEIKNVSSSKYTIPSKYSEFPVFDGSIDSLSEKDELKYERCTLDYYNVNNNSFESYVTKVVSLGYKKNTNVRYDKDNKYIIIDYKSNHLHLVFHIKK